MEPTTNTEQITAVPSVPQTPAPKRGITITPLAAVCVAAVLIAGALLYAYKGLFIAATVDGTPISRLAVVRSLEKQGGAEALDALITEKLVARAIAESDVRVQPEDVDAEIAKLTEQMTSQGGTLAEALAAQNMTETELRRRITEQKQIEMLLADKTAVTPDEVSAYIDENKLTPPEGLDENAFIGAVASQLEQQKFQEAAQTWLTDLKEKADINLYAVY